MVSFHGCFLLMLRFVEGMRILGNFISQIRGLKLYPPIVFDFGHGLVPKTIFSLKSIMVTFVGEKFVQEDFLLGQWLHMDPWKGDLVKK